MKLTALVVAASLAGCSTMRTPPRHATDDVEQANANNDLNGYTIIYGVGLVALLAVAIAVSMDEDPQDPRYNTMPVVPYPETR